MKIRYFLVVGVLGLGVFLEMVGILEGLAPGRRGVSEVSEQAERVSISSEVSEASLPLRLLALLPARLPARLAGPLAEDAARLLSERAGLAAGVVPPFSPVKDPRLECKGGLLSLDVEPPSCPGAWPCSGQDWHLVGVGVLLCASQGLA